MGRLIRKHCLNFSCQGLISGSGSFKLLFFFHDPGGINCRITFNFKIRFLCNNAKPVFAVPSAPSCNLRTEIPDRPGQLLQIFHQFQRTSFDGFVGSVGKHPLPGGTGFLRQWQNTPRKNFAIPNQIMHALAVAVPETQLLFQKFLFRTMQRHILASPAQCHIKCFTVKSLRRNHYIFRSPPL